MPSPSPASVLAVPPVPAEPPAPPFSAGSVIGRAFSVWFRNFLPFSAVTLLVYVPIFALAAWGGFGLDLFEGLLARLADLVVTGALTYGVLQSLDGRPVRIVALGRTGLRKMGWIFLVSFGMGLWVLLGLVLLVIPAFVWYCALYVAVPAVVVEADLGASGALRRSRELTQGRRWAIFVIALVAFLVMLAGAVAGGALAQLVQGAVPQQVPALLATAVVALTSSFSASTSAVAYHDLRVAKEGIATADLVKIFG